MTNLFYRIGIAKEGILFEEMTKYYYGVVINANLVTLYSKWIFSLLQKIKKPFFIDPVSYILALDLDNIKKEGILKKSFEKLIKIYGEKIENIIIGEERELLPGDFIENDKLNQNLIKEFIVKVFTFQKMVGNFPPIQTTITEILEILGKKIKIEKPNLLFLVPPYFYFDSIDDPWYKITVFLAKESIKFKENNEVYPIICMSKSIFIDSENIKKICEDYNGFDGYIIWISDLNEQKEDIKYLEGIFRLVKTFSIQEKPIIILYGEFLSLLFSKKYINGYVRNIGYGERKNVEIQAMGGPIPRRRYYLDLTHSMIPESKIRTFFSLYPNLLCKCEICSKISHKTVDEFFSNIGNSEFNKHFLAVHYNEANLSFNELKELMIKNYSMCVKYKKKIENLGIKYKHLEKWLSIIEK